ncbi:MAG: selenide, water dikinase SelD [Pseudomonadota bacterium]
MTKLTQFSHGAGCGCKIAPNLLASFLESDFVPPADARLLVGNETSDDAAVYQLGDDDCIISTTDFFMPIVDDPHEFGRVAAANAISDVYAMGGRPLMAIAVFGWPTDQLGPDVARRVLEGGRFACREAGIVLAGGHSIDAKEPIFGLAVTGRVRRAHLKRNSTATVGDVLFLTKPLGVGVLTTAEKRGLLKPEHAGLAVESMMRLNTVGALLGEKEAVTAMTDVTGFGLLGHLMEMCDGSGVSARIERSTIPVLEGVYEYIDLDCVPGGSQRNWRSVASQVTALDDQQSALLCDPQTSGGLLLAVDVAAATDVSQLLRDASCYAEPIGVLRSRASDQVTIEVAD